MTAHPVALRQRRSFAKALAHGFLVIVGAVGLTLVFFLVLPLIQAISKSPTADLSLQTVDSANVPPPETAPPEEEPEEEEEEEEPPELEEPELLSLADLELVLDPGVGGGLMSGAGGLDLATLGNGGADEGDGIFSLADLDQKPRPIHRPQPTISAQVRKHTPGKVWIIAEVSERGRVEKPSVADATDPVLAKPALEAIKKWRYEPGKRNGEPVRFRIRQPFTFPEMRQP